MRDHEKDYKTNLTPFIIILLVLAVLLFAFALFAPLLFTNPASSENFDFTHTGEIGDTIGGLMSPFINLSGVIVTGLAFYMQYRANQIQVNIFKDQLQEAKNQFVKEQKNQADQLKLHQFESQFFEMLRLHKENVNEIKIKSLVDGSLVSGREAFVVMSDEFRELISLAALTDEPLTPTEFEAAYSIFFWGYDESVMQNMSSVSEAFISGDGLLSKGDESFPFIKTHKGYGSSLAHYFRHLFMIVKFVVYNEIIPDYEEKMKYLKMLRAQLSNHEQILLFYNWISKYGASWENVENQFFTEYVMIHNLWRKELFQNKFIQKRVKELESKPVKLRQTPLFEHQE